VRTLLVDGHVYSPAENFASALLVEDSVIAWIGSEGGAMVHRGEVDEVVELGGDLVAPGFVDLTADHPHSEAGFLHARRADVPLADGWDEAQWQRHAGDAVAVVPRGSCRLRSRIAAGVPTALAPHSPGVSGWEVVRAAVFDVYPAERLTARAAFSALTRGAWRLLGTPDAGVLRVGAEATFARWRVADLVVQTPDERISNWSTDPRAATPGLPPLEPGTALPDLVQVWRHGVLA
jgi:predicted amidohydrolase YtcJ